MNSTLILDLTPNVVSLKLNALYSIDTGIFTLTDENGNILTTDTGINLTGSQ